MPRRKSVKNKRGSTQHVDAIARYWGAEMYLDRCYGTCVPCGFTTEVGSFEVNKMLLEEHREDNKECK